MYILEKEFLIDCAHQLKDSESLTTKKCLNLHGHTYRIIIKIESPKLIDGMVIDFGKLKEIVDELDHQNLNDKMRDNPTAENMAKYLWDNIDALMGPRDSKTYITVYETPTSKVTFTL
jgi:6-pyruvoyltetrahydropterin/6-carboxytetrahydropterin synthase